VLPKRHTLRFPSAVIRSRLHDEQKAWLIDVIKETFRARSKNMFCHVHDNLHRGKSTKSLYLDTWLQCRKTQVTHDCQSIDCSLGLGREKSIANVNQSQLSDQSVVSVEQNESSKMARKQLLQSGIENKSFSRYEAQWGFHRTQRAHMQDPGK